MNDKSKIEYSIPKQNFQIEWMSPAYFHYKKGWKWFTAAGLIVLVAVVHSIINGQWMSAVVFILLAGVYMMHYLQKVPMIDVGISELGVQIGTRFCSFNLIKAFWINYNPPFSTLHLILANKIQNEVEINLLHQDAAEVRKLLIQEVPELEGRSESFMSIMARLLRL